MGQDVAPAKPQRAQAGPSSLPLRASHGGHATPFTPLRAVARARVRAQEMADTGSAARPFASGEAGPRRRALARALSLGVGE